MTTLAVHQPSLQFASLPKRVRDEVDLLAKLLKQIMAAKPKGPAYEIAARQMCAAGFKCSVAKMRYWEARYAPACDWRMLVNKSKLPHRGKLRVPDAFVEEVKRQFQVQGRSAYCAWQQIVQDWRMGKPMPGYLDHPAAEPLTGIPRGWSYTNLAKLCKSSNFEKVAMRVGLGAAKAKHGPKLFTTRVGLWPFSHIMPDDVDHDNFVHLLEGNRRQLCRASDLGFLDVLSGDRFFWGTKPLFKRIDPKTGLAVTDKWKESAMRFGVCAVLYQYGFSPRGTTWVTELGTAALRENVARIMHDRTKEIYGEALLHVDPSSTTGKQQAIAGFFQGRGGGNPRHKSCLESLHNLIHNKLAALPGQTGPDVDRRPEQLHGMLNESAALLKIMGGLSEYQQKLIKLPTLEYHSEFLPLLRAIYGIISMRHDHNLEGWAGCKFLTDEYRIDPSVDQWIPREKFLALPALAQQAISAVVQDDPSCHRPKRLSPYEVRMAGMHTLIKPPVGMLAEILYEDLAEPRAVKNGYITFDDQTIDPDELRYEARIRTQDGREEELKDGEKYETVASPFQPEMLWVYSKRGDGAFLGIARRDLKPSRADAEGKGRQLARIRERYEDIKAPLITRHAALARVEQRRIQNNIDVINGPASETEQRLEDDRSARMTTTTVEPDEAPTFDL